MYNFWVNKYVYFVLVLKIFVADKYTKRLKNSEQIKKFQLINSQDLILPFFISHSFKYTSNSRDESIFLSENQMKLILN